MLVVAILARSTLFITNDFIADKLRTWFVRVWPKQWWVTMNYYIECPWCVSVTLVGVIAAYPLYVASFSILEIIGTVAASSLVAGTIANLKAKS